MSAKRKRPVGSRRTKPDVDQFNSAARQASRRMRPLDVQALEDRTLLSVTATLAQGVLDVNLSAAGDQALIAPSGSNIVVSGTNDASQSFSNVSRIVVLGSNSASHDVANQVVTIGGSGGRIALHSTTGTDALSVTGVTSVDFANVTVDATSGNVNVLASETTTATGSLANAAPHAAVSVDGAAIQADNVTLNAAASSSFTYKAPLGGVLNSLGVAAAIDQLRPSATTSIVGASTKVSVNGAGGNVAIGAQTNVAVASIATVGKDIKGNALNPASAAIAESVVNSSAIAHVGAGANVGAGSGAGTVSITSTDTTSVTTEVDGSAAVGGGAAAVTLDTSVSQAFVDGNSSLSGGTVNVTATTTNTDNTTARSTATGAGANSAIQNILAGKVDPGYLSMVTPPSPDPADKTSPATTALSGGLPLAVAAAVAVNKFTPTTQAYVDSSTVTAGKSININAAANNNTTTLADGEATTSNASNSVGVGVAIGDTLVSNTAMVEGTAGLSAPTISIQEATPATPSATPNILNASASATSGASGTNVGVAGVLALNIVSSTGGASVPSGSTVSTVGNVTFNAQDNVSETATAQPSNSVIGAIGIGASVALNIASNTTQADLQNTAQLTGAHNLTLAANSNDTVSTNSVAGSSGGSVSISPSAAISVVNNNTDAEVGAPDSAGDPLTVGGSFSANAIHTGLTSTATGAGSGSGSKVSAGVTAALAFVNDQAIAEPNRSINAQGGGVTFLAQGSAASLVSSNASATGAPASTSGSVDSQDSQDRGYADSMGTLTDNSGNKVSAGSTSGDAATPSAKTSDGSISLAAAVSVNVVNSQAVATIPGGLAITATGPLTVQADDDTGSTSNVVNGDTANAWGTDAGTAKLGVGAAVALNLVNASTQATIGQNATIHADGLTVKAGMLGNNPLNVFGALAVSGAGAGSVGVAGAVAINIVNNTSQALIENGASVAAGGGNASVTSLNNSTDTALAQPAGAATGTSLGIGASLGLNIINDTTQSEIQDGASLTNVGNVNVVASSAQTILTWGQDGAAGDVGIGAGIAVAIASDQTTAYVGTGSQALNLSGNLVIGAYGSSSVDTLANAATTAGQTVGIGASVAVNATQDSSHAELDRNVNAGGTVTVAGQATSSSQATSVASESGAGGGDQSADQKVQGLFSFGKGEGGSSSPNVAAPPTSNGELSSGGSSASNASGGGMGQTEVGIAAAVAVNVLNSSSTAAIDGGLTVTSGGALTVGTTNQDAALALADGRATSNQYSFGAAVSLNVANVTNKATINGSDTISAHGVGVYAITPPGAVDDYSTQALGVALGSQAGVAGSAGINVVSINTQASIGSGSVVDSFGGLTVQAREDETLQNIAFTLALGSTAGAGAAVDVNVLNNPTLAFLDSNVRANVADATQVLANSSLTPSQDPVPNSPSDTIIASGTLTQGSRLVSDINGAVLGVLGGSANTPYAGEFVSGDGIPSGTVIVSAINTPFTGTLAFGTNTIVTDDPALLKAKNLPAVGQTIIGPGIAGGTTIVGVTFSVATGYTLTLSAPVIATGSTPLVLSTLLLSQAANTSGPTILTSTPVSAVTSALSSLHPTDFAAGGGGSSGGAGIAGSFVVNVIQQQTTKAYIGNNDAINTLTGTKGHPAAGSDQDVIVATVGTMDIVDWAGAIGAGDDVGAGAALDVNVVNEDGEAYLGTGSVVRAARNVEVNAGTNGSFGSITAAAGLSLSTGIAGAASVEDLSAMTLAYVQDNATVAAGGSVLVQASRQSTINTIAGQVVLGIDASVGASNSTVIDNPTTQATIGSNDQVTALGVGSGSTLYALNGQQDVNGNELTSPVAGLAVVAVSSLAVTPTSVGGAGSIFVGVAGSANVDNLTEVTQALISPGATVNANNAGAGSSQDVVVLASDQTTITSLAGALALAAGGFGAGVDVANIQETTTATIGASSTVTARRHVEVTADSLEQLASTTGTSGLGGSGVSGSAGVYVLNLGTNALIGSGAKVQASGNVLVTASDPTNLMMIAATLAVGGSIGVGGSAVVPVITKVTTASVASNAIVDALGQAGGSTVDNGRYDASYSGTAQGAPGINPSSRASSIAAFSENRTLTPETETISGLAIVATSTDHVTSISAAAGGGEVAGSIAGSAFVPNTTTLAYIGSGARVDKSGLVGNAAQSVLVAAGSDYYHLGVGGAGSVSGSLGASPGIDLTLATNVTTADIGASAQVAPNRDVQVMASQGGAIVSFGIGLSASAGAALAGSVSLFSLKDTTHAYIGNSAVVNAGGNVLVSARDDSGSSMLDGAGALGLGTVGVGGSLSVSLISKDTEAFIDSNAVVNALARNTTAMTVFQDSPDAGGVGTDGSFATTTAYGVAVQAESTEGVYAFAIAGAGGFDAALAGSVTVGIIGATTEAYIGSAAMINQGTTGGPLQSVSVAAADSSSIQGTDGAVAVSSPIDPSLALAGGVDVGVIRDQTSAFIDAGAHVNAQDNVDVFSLAYKSGQSLALSLGIGAIGIAGSVAVYSIDAGVGASASASLKANSPNDNSTTGGYADGQANVSSVTNQLRGYESMGQSGSLVQSSVAVGNSKLQTSDPSGAVSQVLAASTAPMGTAAFVGNSAVITAGNGVGVEANEVVVLQVVAGGGTIGLATGGASVAIANVGSLTQAYVGNGASVTATGQVAVVSNYVLAPPGSAPLSPGSNHLEFTPLVSAYGGNLGLVASLGAQVAILTDTSLQSAHIGETSQYGTAPTSAAGGAQVLGADYVLVEANASRSLIAQAAGGTISVGLALGAAVAEAYQQGTTRAYLGDDTQVGQGAGNVDNLSIDATSTSATWVKCYAVAAGIIGVEVNKADSENTPDLVALIGANSRVKAQGDVYVSATSNAEDARANLYGYAFGGVVGGASLATAVDSPTVYATVSGGATVAANGGITVAAVQAINSGMGAEATSDADGVGLLSGEGENVTATASASAYAIIDPQVNLLADGSVVISANGTNKAAANPGTLVVGAGVSVGAILATATANGTDVAEINDGSTVGTVAHPVGSLTVDATGNDTAYASADLSGGGLFSGLGGNSNATSAPIIRAYLSQVLPPLTAQAPTVNVTNALMVEATSTTNANAETSGAAAGIAAVAESVATSTVRPTVNAYIANFDVVAGSITLQASSTAKPVVFATGSSVGLVGVNGAEADLVADPAVTTTVGPGSNLHSGGNIQITSTSTINGISSPQGGGAGLVAIGDAHGNESIDNSNRAIIGNGATLVARDALTLLATSTNTLSGEVDSQEGGLGTAATATLLANLDYQTEASVGAGALVQAGTTLDIGSSTTTDGLLVASTGGPFGLISGSNATVQWYMGSPGDDSNVALTQTTIGQGASLSAQDATVDATTTFQNQANAVAAAPPGLGGDTHASATVDANETSHVSIQTGAKINGTHSVTIGAENTNDQAVATTRSYDTPQNGVAASGTNYSYNETVVFGPSIFAAQPGLSQVDAAAGATIVTPTLLVQALATFGLTEAKDTTSDYVRVIGNTPRPTWLGVIAADRTIQWNADVVSTAVAAGTLLKVNANGQADPSSNINATITPTQIIVPNLGGGGGGGGGTITFVANRNVFSEDLAANQETDRSNYGLIDGNQATFTYQATSGPVTILNASSKDLVVNNINALAVSPAGQTPSVDINVFTDKSTSPFAFNVAYNESGPTSIDIENTSTTSSPSIFLDGSINNPIGTTTIINAHGNIFSGGTQDIITTNVLNLSAPVGQVGSSDNPLNIDLIQSASLQGVARPIGITVKAGGGAYLNLTGILRDPNINPTQTPFTVPLGAIQAGGDIVASLQAGEQQTTSGTNSLGILVHEDFTKVNTLVSNYFRPGTGTGPAVSLDPGFDTGTPVPINSTYSFANLTAGGNIALNGALTGTNIAITGFTNINPTPGKTGRISATTAGSITLTETAGAMRVGNILSYTGNITLAVPNNTATGDDFVMGPNSSVTANSGGVIIDVADNLSLASSANIGASSNVLIQGDYQKRAGVAGSVISIAGAISAKVARIDGGPDNDVINLTQLPSRTILVVNSGVGVNTINVGSISPPLPNGGDVNKILGALIVNGSGNDTLNVDDTGDTTATSGNLTENLLTGLAPIFSGISYSSLTNLNIDLGSGGNTFTIANTANGTTTTLDSGTGSDTVLVKATSGPLTINTQTGTDTVNVRAIGGVTNVNAGGGNDTINVSSNAPTNTGTLSGIAGTLKIAGGTGHTTANVSDLGDAKASQSTLTATNLSSSVLGTYNYLIYSSLSALNIDLGSGGNAFTIASTASGTTTTLNSGAGNDRVTVTSNSGPLIVNTQAGNDTVLVNSTSAALTVNTQAGGDVVNVQAIGAPAVINSGGDDTINVSSDAGLNTGVLSGIASTLTVNGSGQATLNISDERDALPTTGTLTASALTLSSSAFRSVVDYSKLVSLNIRLGLATNTFLISNTAAGMTTQVNGGPGVNTVNVRAISGTTIVNVAAGIAADVVNVGSLAPSTGGVLGTIQGPLEVMGGSNSEVTLNVDDLGDKTARTGILTATSLTGLGLSPSGIAYRGIATLDIALGQAADVFDVRSSASGTSTTITTQAAYNTWNVGSLAPVTSGGVLGGIQGTVNILGGGKGAALTDTITFDDSGSKLANESGNLTEGSLSGLGMGGSGVTFVGQATLVVNLGNNQAALAGFINGNLPATTTITGGPSNNDSVNLNWSGDFNNTLNLGHLGYSNLAVNGEFHGALNVTAPNILNQLTVFGSVDVGSSISAEEIDVLDILGSLNTDLAVLGIPGAPAGTNALGYASIGDFPTGVTLTAGSIGEIDVNNNLAGSIESGSIGTLAVLLGSITTTGSVGVDGDLNHLYVGHPGPGGVPNKLSVGQNMAGAVAVTGTLGTTRIAGGTPGSFSAGHVGSIGAYGGFGPVALQVYEGGGRYRVELAAPGQFYLQSDNTSVAGSPYVNVQYLYESAGYAYPQLSATITNHVGSAPDQFDLSTVALLSTGATDPFVKLNVARVDSVGISGLRNLAVEGDLVPGVSATASTFFAGDKSPGGVYLPYDDIAGVGIRDHAPNGSIVAGEIQGVAFGSFTSTQGVVEPGSYATNADAARLLGVGTRIVQAGSVGGNGTDTFRVPFAAQPGQQAAFFLDTAPGGGAFDPNDMIFTHQSNGDGVHPATVYTPTRGAVTAMIGVAEAVGRSTVQTVDLYGDGGSLLSEQFIAQAITSTGPLGDLTVLVPQGLDNVTAPSIFGNIAAAGPIFGTIQTTGVRTDPVSGKTSTIAADLGRAYVVQTGGRTLQQFVTTTTIQGQGPDSFAGRIISRGNLISSVRSDGGSTGLIAVQGDLGAASTLLGTPTRVGGLLVNGGFDGQLVVLGNDYGDLTFHGGLNGGRVAVEGTGGARSGILGNVIVDRGIYPTGAIGAGSAIVSGGEIGDATYGTSLSVADGNQGIVASIGTTHLASGTKLGGSFFNNAGGTSNAAAIDAIFTDQGQPLALDLAGKPLGGLELILQDLAALYVNSTGKLAGTKP